MIIDLTRSFELLHSFWDGIGIIFAVCFILGITMVAVMLVVDLAELMKRKLFNREGK